MHSPTSVLVGVGGYNLKPDGDLTFLVIEGNLNFERGAASFSIHDFLKKKEGLLVLE